MKPALISKSSIPSLLALVLSLSMAGSALAAEEGGPGYHHLKVDPAIKDKVDAKTAAELGKFFHSAEVAIAAGDLEKLMGLYSENYRNEEHDKNAARQIWSRMFGAFSDMATMHNMSVKNVSQDGKTAFVACSGMLLGKKRDGGVRGVVDTWTNEEHVLTLENGQWKLIGTAGQKRKRLWFDKPMHPLF